MLKKILLGALGAVVLAVVVVLGIASTKPDDFEIMRARDVAASRATMTPLLTELRNWERWSPWHDLDPNQTITYSPTTSGVGAWYQWHGNAQVGRGRSEIVGIDERADRTVVRYHLRFEEPMQDEADVTFELIDLPNGKTRATWSMASGFSFIEKIFCVFMDVEEMVGKDFDKGLERLDRVATSGR